MTNFDGPVPFLGHAPPPRSWRGSPDSLQRRPLRPGTREGFWECALGVFLAQMRAWRISCSNDRTPRHAHARREVRRMKVLLLNLPREGEAVDYTTSDYLLTDFSKYPPLGLMAIATGVDRGKHDVTLHDANIKALSIADTVDYIERERPDLLGLSVVTRRLY